MSEKKDQYIAAYIADYTHSEVVLSYALFIANMLRKGLILLRIVDPKYTSETTSEAERHLQELKIKIHLNNNVTYCAIKGNTKDILTALPVALNVVTVIGAVDKNAHRKSPLSKKNVLKNFSECKTAFLLAQEPLKNSDTLQNIAFSIDFKKESKDKFLWASYFSRFNNSFLHSFSPKYEDEFLRAKWFDNTKFLDKMFASLNVKYEKHSIAKQQSQYLDIDVLQYASTKDIGLLVSTTTKERDVMEYFIGVQEDKTIINEYKIPILYLNPREDLYVLCD
jgi:hypothetical protein